MRKILISLLLFCSLMGFSQGTSVVYFAPPVESGVGNFVSNGDFASGSTDWNLGASWTVPSNAALFDDVEHTDPGLILGQATGDMISPVVVDVAYNITFDIVMVSNPGGVVQMEIGSSDRVINYVAGGAYFTDSYDVDFTAPSDIGVGGISFRSSASATTTTYTLDNIVLTLQ